jgi:hypothetical protein
MGPRSFRIRISGPKIWSAPPKSHLPYNFCFINFFPSVTVAAVDALQTLFRAPLTPGVHPGGRNIAYDLALVKLGPHTKFGEDWSNGLAVHWIHTYIHTYRQTTWQIYIRFQKTTKVAWNLHEWLFTQSVCLHDFQWLEYNGYIIVCRRLPRDIGQEA